MKSIKLLLLAILLLVGNYIAAQSSPFSFTINAGGSLSDMRIKGSSTDSKYGFRGGLGLEMNLPNNLFLQTGLDFAMKGANSSSMAVGDINGDGYSPDVYMSEEKVRASYLVLPIKAGYRLNVSREVCLNFTFGPYLGYGIGGKYKAKEALKMALPGDSELSSGTYTEYSEYEYDTFSSETLKRFDMGLAGSVGVECKRILLNFGYEHGLINYSRGSSKSYNSALFLTLGYRIF